MALTQSQLLKEFIDENRETFTPELFERSDNEIVEHLLQVIKSCQRDKYFTIKVLDHEIVEDYEQIITILQKYENSLSKNKTKRKDNRYDYIDLKDSDIKLLIVKYFIKINDEEEIISVIIAYPRVVDKFYFRLNGNTYSAMYQIVDASTYNNSTSNSKKPSVTLKTMFQPIKLYRTEQDLKTTKKEKIKCTYYRAYAFKKSVPAPKYIFAKFGYWGALCFMKMSSIFMITDYDPDDENFYTFTSKKNDKIFISVAKYPFNNDQTVQAITHTLWEAMCKDTTVDKVFTNEFWVSSLGYIFNQTNSLVKGGSVLDSFEFIYDLGTKTSIHLPEEQKSNVYCILRWMINEFARLRLKDNLNITTKKIRWGEYIASLYAMKLAAGVYRISDQVKRANLSFIKKAIMISPMYLLSSISKCQLVNYRNMVNDADSMAAIKFTYKGIAGIGENSSNAIPNIYRLVDKSNLGIVDPDSSSATDPGITGTICPLVKIYDGGYFSEFEEPNMWDMEFDKTMKTYRDLVGLKEAMILKNIVLDKPIDVKVLSEVETSIETVGKLVKPMVKSLDGEYIDGIPLETGGMIIYG